MAMTADPPSPPARRADPASAPAKPADRRARFWDRVAAGYAKSPIKDMAAYENKLAMTRKVLAPNMNVLELGCGTGGTALWHAPTVAHIRATDISRNMVAIAREKAAAAEVSNVDFEVAAVDALSVRAHTYDAVLAMSLLHLVPDRDTVIADVRRWLKPGGVFVTSTVCLSEMMPVFRLLYPFGRALGFFPLVRAFRAQALCHSLERAGFVLETVWRPSPKSAVFIIARKPEG